MLYTSLMQLWQTLALGIILLYSLTSIVLGHINLYKRKNPFGLAPFFNLIGVFVWADAVVFGIFFAIAALAAFILGNILLFLLIYSVFWVIRSIGEQVYWFLEQFAQNHRNSPTSLKMSKFYHGESIYIHYQIFWQCISAVAIISSVYFFYQLLTS